MKMIICLLALAAVVSTASAGSCPSLTVMDPFLITSFAGTWYNQYSKNTPVEMGSCLVSNYTYDAATEVMSIKSTLKTIFGWTETMSGEAVLANSSSTAGNLILTYASPIKDFVFDLSVLSSDYDTYVILYSCTKILFYPYESTWILTRDQTVDSATVELIKTAMEAIAMDGGPSFADMKQNDQSNCS